MLKNKTKEKFSSSGLVIFAFKKIIALVDDEKLSVNRKNIYLAKYLKFKYSFFTLDK